jgi:hypothetical protein
VPLQASALNPATTSSASSTSRSIDRPNTLSIRERLALPTGTLSGSPVSSTLVPRASPGRESLQFPGRHARPVAPKPRSGSAPRHRREGRLFIAGRLRSKRASMTLPRTGQYRNSLRHGLRPSVQSASWQSLTMLRALHLICASALSEPHRGSVHQRKDTARMTRYTDYYMSGSSIWNRAYVRFPRRTCRP